MSSVLAVLSSTVLAVAGVLTMGREAPVAGLDPDVLGAVAVGLAVMIGAATVLLWAARGPGAVGGTGAVARSPHRRRARG
ncbi:hypothetical protein [Thalassiella azotivora]